MWRTIGRAVWSWAVASVILASSAHAATLISCSTGNLTDATTWCLASSTAELDSEAASTACTTSYVYSSTFVPAGTAIDAVAVKLAARVASPVGTVTVQLYNNTTASEAFAVAINATDLTAIGTTATPGGWQVFKNGSTHTPNGTDTYKIGFKCSTASQATLYRDGTAGNWSRQVRTTTTGTDAVAGDKLIIAGELTGAGTGNDITVTMDATSSTTPASTVSYGNAAWTVAGVSVNKRGTLAYSTTASTTFGLKFKGIMGVYSGGTFTIGTSGARIPSTSRAELLMDVASNVDTGLVVGNGGTWNFGGNNISYVSTLLAANSANGDTSITTADTTGWKSGDELAIASTTRTYTECESKALSGDCTGTSCPIAALGTADTTDQCGSGTGGKNHCGVSPVQAEVINLTRNVLLRGASASLQGYVWIGNLATVSGSYGEFKWLGSATANKRGIDITTTTGSASISYSALHDFVVTGSRGIYVTGNTSNNYTLDHNVSYYMADSHFVNTATSGTAWSITNHIGLYVTTGSGVSFDDIGGTFTNVTVAGASGAGLYLNDHVGVPVSASSLVAHSNGGVGIHFPYGPGPSTFSNLVVWRNNSTGVQLRGYGITLNNVSLFGNVTRNLDLHLASGRIAGLVANGDTKYSTSFGVMSGTGSSGEWNFDNANLGTASGLLTTHSTADVTAQQAVGDGTKMLFANSIMASSSEVQNGIGSNPTGIVCSQRHDQTAGNHKCWKRYGIVGIDQSNYYTAAPGELMTFGTNGGVGRKLESSPKRVAVPNGGAATISVKVCQATTYGGATYARLMRRKNVACHTSDTADVVIDTAISTTGTCAGTGGTGWQELTGTAATVDDDCVEEFYVDGEDAASSTGTLTVDDWAVP